MSARNHLTSEQKEILEGLCEEGMTTLKRKDLIKKAVDRTALEEQTIKVIFHNILNIDSEVDSNLKLL
jgi:hypothetical protein